MDYLTKDSYKEIAFENMDKGRHWKYWQKRWSYFKRSIDVVKSLNITNPKKVLEMGTMGVTVVKNCDTLDYAEKWDFEGKNPTYLHDARRIPWPVEDNQYDLFIALRVFQHLGPKEKQKECFLEAKRIAKNILIVTPKKYKTSFGLEKSDFIKWNKGVPPKIYENVYDKNTFLYFW